MGDYINEQTYLKLGINKNKWAPSKWNDPKTDPKLLPRPARSSHILLVRADAQTRSRVFVQASYRWENCWLLIPLLEQSKDQTSTTSFETSYIICPFMFNILIHHVLNISIINILKCLYQYNNYSYINPHI